MSPVLRCSLRLALAPTLLAQTPLDTPGARAWGFDHLNKNHSQASVAAQIPRLRAERAADRRAALVALGSRPLGEWAEFALNVGSPEVIWYLFHKGYRQPGADPLAYLSKVAQLDRPWTQGLGLHLEPQEGWRLQWVPSPLLLGQITQENRLPKALEAAPIPTVLLHLRQLRPGLERLQKLAGGDQGLGRTLLDGGRAGFLLRHFDAWLKGGTLEGLATKEAWVLHYGRTRRGEGPEGTLLFLPGDLPTGVQWAMNLLKLNPFQTGVRSRTETWEGPSGAVKVTQVRGAGGVLHLVAVAGGTLLSDREAPLRAMTTAMALPTLGERADWARVALAGEGPQTQVSLWMVPTEAAGAVFECQALLRRKLRAEQPTWPNPFVAKAAPRTGDLSLALGAGPTEVLLRTFLRADHPFAVEDPKLPAFTGGGQNLSASQRQAYELELDAAKTRRERQKTLRGVLASLEPLLDLRGAALTFNGFVKAPIPTAAQKQALAEYRRFLKSDYAKARQLVSSGRLGHGRFGEPGFVPAMALALPIQAGKEAMLQPLVSRLWPLAFRGTVQKKQVGDVELRRIQTIQVFSPTWAIAKGHLLVGTDEASVAAMVAGLQGQGPTLADWDSKSFGRGDMDGNLLAGHLEELLVAYLRSRSGTWGQGWWDPPAQEDDARAEVASTFGPFLGALRGMGRRNLDLNWTPAGLEIRPR